jgi:hypothetical protein
LGNSRKKHFLLPTVLLLNLCMVTKLENVFTVEAERNTNAAIHHSPLRAGHFNPEVHTLTNLKKDDRENQDIFCNLDVKDVLVICLIITLKTYQNPFMLSLGT